MEQVNRSKVCNSRGAVTVGLVFWMLLLALFPETLESVAAINPGSAAVALFALSAAVLVLVLLKRRTHLEPVKKEGAAGGAAETGSGGASPEQALRPQGVPARNGAEAGSVQRRGMAGSRKRWTREDGFTLAGTRVA
jgi:hypothetical protein